MQRHTKTYFEYFGVTPGEYIACEICRGEAVDLHHIVKRSFFGKNKKHEQDRIENIIALCRRCHEKAEAKILTPEELTFIHLQRIGKH